MRRVRIGDASPAKPSHTKSNQKLCNYPDYDSWSYVPHSVHSQKLIFTLICNVRIHTMLLASFFLRFFFSSVLLIRNNIKCVQKLISQIGIRDCVCLALFNRIQMKRALLMTIYELLVAIHFEIPERAGPTVTVCLVSKSRH